MSPRSKRACWEMVIFVVCVNFFLGCGEVPSPTRVAPSTTEPKEVAPRLVPDTPHPTPTPKLDKAAPNPKIPQPDIG